MSSLGDLHNVQRSKRGLVRLQAHDPLMRAAISHAEWMAAHSKMTHAGAGGSVGNRVKEEGYAYALVGENIAYGYRDEAKVLKAWLRSAGHKANILHPSFRHIGYAMRRNKRGVPYWCVVFGTDSSASYVISSAEATFADEAVGVPLIDEAD